MKKNILLCLCIIFVVPATLQAKNSEQRRYDDNFDYIDYKKSEVYIQYGAPSIIELTNKLETKILDPLGLELDKTKYTGIGAVGYNLYLNPYVSLGAYFGISEADMRLVDKKTGKDVYTNHVRNYTGMLGVNWTYFRSGIWEATCGAWLGLAQLDERQELYFTASSETVKIPKENDRYRFAYHLTATRVRVGGGVIGAYAEVGFGYKGIANVGVSVKF